MPKKAYVKDSHGLRIRIHNPPVSSEVVEALGYVVEQIIERKYEWSLHGGRQALVESAVWHHRLKGKDLRDFISELRARKYGLDYKAILGAGKTIDETSNPVFLLEEEN